MNSACSELELGAFMGIEMKRGLTANGLRQAEVEYYLWAGCSMFPFVQIITDMQIRGAAFYGIGSSPAGFASKSIGRRMSAFLFYTVPELACHQNNNQDVACNTPSFCCRLMYCIKQSIYYLIWSVISPPSNALNSPSTLQSRCCCNGSWWQ